MKNIIYALILVIFQQSFATTISHPPSYFVNKSPLIVSGKIIKIAEYSLDVDSLTKYNQCVIDTAFLRINKIYKNNTIYSLTSSQILKLNQPSKKSAWYNSTFNTFYDTTTEGRFILDYYNSDSTIFFSYTTGCSEENLEKLLKADNLNNILLNVIKANNIDSVKILVDLGASLNNYDYDYFLLHWTSPLFKSIEIGNMEITEYLLKNGANPKIKRRGAESIYQHIDKCKIKDNDKDKLRKLIKKYSK